MNTVNDQQQRGIQSSAPIRFPLRHIVATPGSLDVLERGAVDASLLLQRHRRGDWRNVPPDDAEENGRSVKIE